MKYDTENMNLAFYAKAAGTDILEVEAILEAFKNAESSDKAAQYAWMAFTQDLEKNKLED